MLRWKPFLRAASHRLPLALLAVSFVLTAFAYGVVVGKYQTFPYRLIADGVKTGRVALGVYSRNPQGYDFPKLQGFSDMPPDGAAAHRIEFMGRAELSEPLLWYGGNYQFLEQCPDYGCIAVEYNRAGEIARSWPYRPDALEQAAAAFSGDEFPYELALNFSFAQSIFPLSVSLYPNGDLLVVFQHFSRSGAFPYGAGVARINPDGYPVWFRRDYSHHWAQLLDNGVALVPSLRVGNDAAFYRPQADIGKPACDTGKPYTDAVHYIDGNGRLLKSIDVTGALLASSYAPLLGQTTDPCDPVHLNFVRLIGDDYVGADDIAPGDLVVSLRNISAFAILDGTDGGVKRVVRGSFAEQHSVQHWKGSRFLMFDNQNLYNDVPVQSRLLVVDLASGRETTVFPQSPYSPPPPQLPHLFSRYSGDVAVSSDRERALVAFTRIGIAVEIRLADGEVLNIFRNLHDISGVEAAPDASKIRSGVFDLFGLEYIRQPLGDAP